MWCIMIQITLSARASAYYVVLCGLTFCPPRSCVFTFQPGLHWLWIRIKFESCLNGNVWLGFLFFSVRVEKREVRFVAWSSRSQRTCRWQKYQLFRCSGDASLSAGMRVCCAWSGWYFWNLPQLLSCFRLFGWTFSTGERSCSVAGSSLPLTSGEQQAFLSAERDRRRARFQTNPPKISFEDPRFWWEDVKPKYPQLTPEELLLDKVVWTNFLSLAFCHCFFLLSSFSWQ